MKVHTTLTSLLIGASINYVDAQTITTYPCPSAGQQSILPISSTTTTSITIRVPIISDPNGLCTLTRHNVVTGNAPVARSYSNRSWELTAGLFAKTDSGVSIDCDAGSIHECEVTLPPMTTPLPTSPLGSRHKCPPTLKQATVLSSAATQILVLNIRIMELELHPRRLARSQVAGEPLPCPNVMG